MAVRTKQAIRQAFIELLNERPLDKISVKDIAERSTVNRNTFYYYYADIYALVEEIFQTETQLFMEKLHSYASWEEAFREATAFVSENKRAVHHLFNSGNRNILEHYYHKVTYAAMLSYVRGQAEGLSAAEEDIQALAQFYAAALVRLHDHGVALVELAVDDQRRERFLDVVHQRPLERTHAVARLVAHGRQPVFGPFGDLHLVAQPARAGHQPLQFQVDDPFHVGDLQRAEQHDVVDAVEELRGEGVLQSLAVLALGRPVGHGALRGGAVTHLHRFPDHGPRTHVRGHNDDRVPEVDLASRAVGEVSFVEDLQHGVEDLGMGLLDLVEEHHGVGLTTHGLR